MKQHWKIVWISALVLGWLFDFLFWKQAPGINFAIYATLCTACGFVLLSLDHRRIAPRAAWLVLLIAIFGAITFLRAEPLTVLLATLLTLFLMALLTVSFLGGRWLEYGAADYLVRFLRLLWSVITRPLAFLTDVRRERAGDVDRRTGLDLWPVLRGILIALPVVVIFAALLGSADVIFGAELNSLLRLLRLENLPQYVFRLAYILVAAYALIGVFLHAASQSSDEGLLGEGKPPPARFLGFVEAAIVLGSVIVLFSAFVIVQFRYFFGGQVNIGIEGYTYSEYARRGFGELIAVAFFSLLMILGLGAVSRRQSPVQQRLFSGLSVVLVALVSIMLVSAYQRLNLYEMAYGFSRLRTYVHVALIWLGVLLAAVVLLETLRRDRAIAAAALVASLGFALTLSAVNVDAFIVRQNVDRAVRGQKLDVPYLATLSTDSVPALAGIFRSPAYPPAIREMVGAALACRYQMLARRESTDWRSFTISRWMADNAMKTVGSQLADFRVTSEPPPVTILTPGDISQPCVSSGR